MPNNPRPMNWPAGWYPDPWAATAQQFSDGHEWTGQRIFAAPTEAPISDRRWHQWCAVALGVLAAFTLLCAFTH